MHRLGTSVLTLIILPLAFSCDHKKTQITEDYRNIIRIQLKHVEAIIEQVNLNCTVRNVSMSKEPQNTQSIPKKICRANGKLRRMERESENVNGQLKDALHKLVEEINTSLRCWCHGKREGTIKPKQQIRKWKLCRVKDILANLQRRFEQYNVYLSLSTDLPERGKTSEQTGI
ncbi:hypothetical protein G5714_023432 [Onychostoma macrolepis]|uniref:Interleukin-7 n=1 Tax=Onychostoma macrolepis TaxID=369639 RepID=A0A7J6BL83_9TELE|nr:hypothetical protein G5714_023432 [Onychostoma macrolepis]